MLKQDRVFPESIIKLRTWLSRLIRPACLGIKSLTALIIIVGMWYFAAVCAMAKDSMSTASVSPATLALDRTGQLKVWSFPTWSFDPTKRSTIFSISEFSS